MHCFFEHGIMVSSQDQLKFSLPYFPIFVSKLDYFNNYIKINQSISVDKDKSNGSRIPDTCTIRIIWSLSWGFSYAIFCCKMCNNLTNVFNVSYMLAIPCTYICYCITSTGPVQRLGVLVPGADTITPTQTALPRHPSAPQNENVITNSML